MIEKAKVAVVKDRKLLIVYNGENYSLPGGRVAVRYGESGSHAARRETVEETHGRVSGLRLYCDLTYSNGSEEDVHTRVYRGRISGRLTPSREIEELEWARRDEIGKKYKPVSTSLKKIKIRLIRGRLI